jgi:hypothetical protein
MASPLVSAAIRRRRVCRPPSASARRKRASTRRSQRRRDDLRQRSSARQLDADQRVGTLDRDERGSIEAGQLKVPDEFRAAAPAWRRRPCESTRRRRLRRLADRHDADGDQGRLRWRRLRLDRRGRSSAGGRLPSVGASLGITAGGRLVVARRERARRYLPEVVANNVKR